MTIRRILRALLHAILNLGYTIAYWKYRLYDVKQIPSKSTKNKVERIRNKETITVAFIVYDIAKWKTEALYLKMLEHPRFNPVIVPIMFKMTDYSMSAYRYISCIDYLKSKGHNFIPGDPRYTIDELVKPDIVFYGEPYIGSFDKEYEYSYKSKRDSLPVYVAYYLHNNKDQIHDRSPLDNLAWLNIAENESVVEDLKLIMQNKAKNVILTGSPMCDAFINSSISYKDVWKKQNERKKRIIWAPSHSIPGALYNTYEQSTFLSIADDMLYLAEKYKDSIQWAFKPHPVLKRKLIEKWGQTRTEEYYQKWSVMENTQLEEGAYSDLFMSSDALIHDCQSFIVEYMFTEKPVMFLDNGKGTYETYNTQTLEAYKIHYKGNDIKDIESFIENVILDEKDSLKENRKTYKEHYLVPPYGKSACENIINAILAEEDYAEN